MAKAKSPKKLSRIDFLEQNLSNLVDHISQANKRLSDLEAAICPRVAARLTALERQVAKQAVSTAREFMDSYMVQKIRDRITSELHVTFGVGEVMRIIEWVKKA